MRLSEECFDRLPAPIARYGYDRAAHAVGIVHFGIGAFHRAHQAWYTDAALAAGDKDWMILGVSLRTPDVSEQMTPQDGLFTVTERSPDGANTRLIGSVRGVVVARDNPAAVVAALAAPATQIVSLTITEKGYCRQADGRLDLAAAGPGSFFAFLAQGLALRRAEGLPGLTVMSCDNLADNGGQLRQLMADYCAHHDPDLGAWIAQTCTFPATMVDRIVPAPTDADRAAVAAALGGIEDAAAIITEPFSQWVIQDWFAGPRPKWETVGAQLVQDVAPYELAKLRMLNGAHSALAYLGLSKGHEFVHQAIADPDIGPLVRRLMVEEALPTIPPSPGQNLMAYAEALLARFANPALQHRLRQIAMDGSQKIPQRWLAVLANRAERGQDSPALLTALAAWVRHSRGDHGPVEDPNAAQFAHIWADQNVPHALEALFGAAGIFASSLVLSEAQKAELLSLLTG